MIISFAQSKGGTTKSTLAANFATWLQLKGHEVASLDLDAGEFGNQSLAAMLADHTANVCQPESPAHLRQLLCELTEQYPFIVADAPGGFQHTRDMNIELLRHTDFALIPVKPELGDIEPLLVVEQIVDEAKKTNPFLEARGVVNCVDARTIEGRDLPTTLNNIKAVAPNLPVMKQTIGVNRAFEKARRNGTIVVAGPRSAASNDLEALFAELLSDMIVSINNQETRQDLPGLSKRNAHQETVNDSKTVNE